MDEYISGLNKEQYKEFQKKYDDFYRKIYKMFYDSKASEKTNVLVVLNDIYHEEAWDIGGFCSRINKCFCDCFIRGFRTLNYRIGFDHDRENFIIKKQDNWFNDVIKEELQKFFDDEQDAEETLSKIELNLDNESVKNLSILLKDRKENFVAKKDFINDVFPVVDALKNDQIWIDSDGYHFKVWSIIDAYLLQNMLDFEEYAEKCDRILDDETLEEVKKDLSDIEKGKSTKEEIIEKWQKKEDF